MIRKMGTVVEPVPQPPGYNARIRAERAAGGYGEQLERAREAARGWQTAQVAILGLISIVGTVKSKQDIDGLPMPARLIAAAAMVLALLAAVLAVNLLGLAARPLPRLRPRTGTPDSTTAVKAIQRAYRQIRNSLTATVVAVCLLAVAVVTTWLPTGGSPTEGMVRLVTSTNTLCGRLAESNGSTVVVKIGGQSYSAPSREVVSLVPVTKCD